MLCMSSRQPWQNNGFLIWEWLVALTLLGGFALFAIAFLARQEAYALQQQQLQVEDRKQSVQRRREWTATGHRLLFDLQEGQ